MQQLGGFGQLHISTEVHEVAHEYRIFLFRQVVNLLVFTVECAVLIRYWDNPPSETHHMYRHYSTFFRATMLPE